MKFEIFKHQKSPYSNTFVEYTYCVKNNHTCTYFSMYEFMHILKNIYRNLRGKSHIVSFLKLINVDLLKKKKKLILVTPVLSVRYRDNIILRAVSVPRIIYRYIDF